MPESSDPLRRRHQGLTRVRAVTRGLVAASAAAVLGLAGFVAAHDTAEASTTDSGQVTTTDGSTGSTGSTGDSAGTDDGWDDDYPSMSGSSDSDSGSGSSSGSDSHATSGGS